MHRCVLQCIAMQLISLFGEMTLANLAGACYQLTNQPIHHKLMQYNYTNRLNAVTTPLQKITTKKAQT